MTTPMIELDDIVTMIEDIADELGTYVHPDSALADWRLERYADDNVPEEWKVRDAAEAIATIIAAQIQQGDEELVDAAMQDMMTDEGWRFWQHDVVLSIQSSDDEDTLVVWLGNDRDFDMCRIGHARINY